MKPKRKPFTLYIPDDTKQIFKEHADQRSMDLGPWLLQAGLSYVRSARRSASKNAAALNWSSAWPKAKPCPFCFKLGHDPVEQHKNEYAPGVAAKEIAEELNGN